jgi:hypothetical protein
MRIDRHSPTGYAGEADWRRTPTAETASTAVASVGRTEAASFRLRNPGGEHSYARQRERLLGVGQLMTQTSESIAQARAVLAEGSEEDRGSQSAKLQDAMAVIEDAATSPNRPGFFHIFPPLPSPLANVRAALRAYLEQGGEAPNSDLEKAPEVRELLSQATDLLAGNGGVAQTVQSLRAEGASNPAIESAFKELEVRLDIFREKLAGVEVFPKVPSPKADESPRETLDVAA